MKKNLPDIKVKGIRVLTTKQIAELYGTSKDKIIYNFNYNKEKYILGKHYIEVTGEELRRLKTTCENQISFKYAKSLYLWTEKGALLHAKSLNTDKAWEVYDYLVDFYFRVKGVQEEKKLEIVPVQQKVEPLKNDSIPKMDNPLGTLKILLDMAAAKGIKVRSANLRFNESRLKGNRIAVRTMLTIEQACYEIAYELSHAYVHYMDGDIINSPLQSEYDQQAERAAYMLLEAIECSGKIA